MNIDFFNLLDGVFRGLILFVYNSVQTLVLLVRHPLRGALRSYSRYRSPVFRQVGPWTLLFLTFLSALFLWGSFGVAALLSLDRYLSADFTEKTLLPRVIGALVSSATADALFRLAVRRRRGEKQKVRERRIALLEYNFALLPLSFSSLSIIALLLDKHIGSQWEMPLFVVWILIGTVPVVYVGTVLTSAGRGWSLARLAVVAPTGILVAVMTMVLSLDAGFLVAAAMVRARTPPSDVVVTAVKCDLLADPATVTVVFFNPTSRPMFVRRKDRYIQVGSFRAPGRANETQTFHFNFDEPATVDVGIAPNTSVALRGSIRQKFDFTGAQPGSCRFEDNGQTEILE